MAFKDQKYYLRRIHIDEFGSAYNVDIEGFEPGLNVVYGKNESGKSTIANFIKGVIVGWNKSKKQGVNNYESEKKNRSGQLVFTTSNDDEDSTDDYLLKRVNDDFEHIDLSDTSELTAHTSLDRSHMVLPQDEQTFETLNMLSSESLMSLNSNNSSSKLLAASSGTKVSPAEAYENIDVATKDFYYKGAVEKQNSLPQIIKKIEIEKSKLLRYKTQYQQISNMDTDSSKIKEELNFNKKQIKKCEEAYKDIASARDLHANIKKNKNSKIKRYNKFIAILSAAGIAVTILSSVCLFLCMSNSSYLANNAQALTLISTVGLVIGVLFVVSSIVIGKSKINGVNKAIAKETDKLQNTLEKYGIYSNDKDVEEYLDELKQDTDKKLKEYHSLNDSLNQQLGEAKGQKSKLDDIEEKIQQINIEIAKLNQHYFKASQDLLVHLLAKHMLADVIDNWKQTEEQDVYKTASMFLSVLTDKAWNKIIIKDNKMYVCKNDKVLPVNHLSRSTTQQLYLALRMAIVINPNCEYYDSPIICDDILVDFDENRQLKAIEALKELGKSRQIILFTAHQSVFNNASKFSQVNCMELV